MKNLNFQQKPPKIYEFIRSRFFCQLAATATVLPYLQPAVDRQPGHRRGDREEVGRNIPQISSRSLRIILE